MKDYRAVVLLSAYGNSPFIKAQTESIISQLTSDDALVIIDDGSGSVPWEQISHLRTDNCIYMSRLRNLGTKLSFLELLFEYNLRGYYYFFADQDDLWYPNKIKTQIEKMQKTQGDMSWSLHSVDLIDGEDSHIGRLDPIEPLNKIHYFFECPQAGMTYCLDYRCVELLKRYIPLIYKRDRLTHDQVISAILLLYKEPIIIKHALAAYRLHGANQTGIRDKHWLSRIKDLKVLSQRKTLEQIWDVFEFFESVKKHDSLDVSVMFNRVRSRLFIDELTFKSGYVIYKLIKYLKSI